MEEIINRVTNSSLLTIDLESFYPEGNRISFDLKDFLYKGLVLKEREFRQQLKNHDWEQYRDAFVAIDCSTQAILPGWAFMLITVHLQTVAMKVVKGDLKLLEILIFNEIVSNIDVSVYKDQKVIIKGCSRKPVPDTAYMQLIERLQPLVSSLMFGEPCSTVPLMKRK